MFPLYQVKSVQVQNGTVLPLELQSQSTNGTCAGNAVTSVCPVTCWCSGNRERASGRFELGVGALTALSNLVLKDTLQPQQESRALRLILRYLSCILL